MAPSVTALLKINFATRNYMKKGFLYKAERIIRPHLLRSVLCWKTFILGFKQHFHFGFEGFILKHIGLPIALSTLALQFFWIVPFFNQLLIIYIYAHTYYQKLVKECELFPH